MNSFVSLLLRALCFSGTFLLAKAQTAEEREKYAQFTKIADRFGYGWEAHTVETQDGWYLTLLRITSVQGRQLSAEPKFKGKPPVLMQHGALNSGHMWAQGLLGPGLPVKLAERGYDVWLGHNRGTIYSNVHKNDGQPGWTLKDRWDFDWSDMGTYDIPAAVKKIIEVTGKPKVTLMGYSQGGAQIFYALAKNQDWYAERVHRFVGLAACMFLTGDPTRDYTYDEHRHFFKKANDLGVYNLYGDDASSLDAENCQVLDLCGLYAFQGYGESMKSLLYFTQIEQAGIFQEPQSLERWVAGEKYTTPVDLSRIDRVPVSIVHPVADGLCDPVMIEWTYTLVRSKEKYIRFEKGGHLLFALDSSDDLLQRMVETIEFGTTQDIAQFPLAGPPLSAFVLIFVTALLIAVN